ncbi:ArsR/SmtB family transcription factor [Microbulbifer thermotolerans]|uniref:Metalloregulator ArsR/SmtB family transcription factor n=1 Tax=Microbulbifer thermotolerans TaxID=252514 RepID=A0A143HNS5_MICTH|nr:metalloregulator ArsR/SmtB family transcription factor [Microbulbifer thermotolerans]AMX03147.1 transcriptional regulator [Microbulbifer thermotolerans]MCX2780161.1 metalloregulator ArsR/SmtB family transcription factor [Microbulbifer thermotolerans]MCX2783447.1 metalloregulator ArsR/SmtB family transcription factor [Microbulbifer thermotolerans]MCX2795841.1 metalloregulator ArsR/SmtB family transcription factor [Microbulbifer thermotolerans]MCX2803305.1 metalloregulator ArsR/SmtB family tr
MLTTYVDTLKALADPNRLRLFWLLTQIDQRVCVAEAMDVLGDSHYNVSRNLKTLLKANLLTASREGKWVFYTLNNDGSAFNQQILAAVREIPAERFQKEIKRCQLRLAMRKNGQCVVGPNSEEWEAALAASD